MKRKRLLVPKPETYESALLWFIEFAPKFYHNQIDYQLSGVANTRSRMKISQTQQCWRDWLGFQNLYDRCRFLLMVQSVYLKLEREELGLQESISCNLHIGWTAGIVQAFNDILVKICYQNGNESTMCKAKLQCEFKKLYSYSVFVKWDDLIPQLHPNVARFKDGDNLYFDNMIDHIGERMSTSMGQQSNSLKSQTFWAEKEFMEKPLLTCLFTICPLTDFVLHYVVKETQQALTLPIVVTNIVTSYIGVVNVQDIW
jgi:hypothetical protein